MHPYSVRASPPQLSKTKQWFVGPVSALFIIKYPHCVASDPLQLSMRASRICRRMFLALMKEVRSLMLYTTTKPSAQSTGSSSIHLASELCQEKHMLLFRSHADKD